MDHQREVRTRELAAEPMRPAGPRQGFFVGSLESIRDVWARRELLGQLTRREIKARYKDSALGFFWSLAKPLTMLLVYYVAIGKFLGAARSVPDFAIFIFAGLTAWQLFSDIVIIGTGSIVGNAGLIKKVYVPRELFPLSVIGSALFNFAIQLGVLIGATAVLGRFPTGERWLFFVLSMAVVLPFAAALALLLSALNVYLRDIAYLVEIMLMILMWASPIVYSWAQVSKQIGGTWLETVYLANPMTQVSLGFQKAFWVSGDGQPFPADLGRTLALTFVVSIVLLWFSQRVFARLQSNFAQEL
ncbi:ABC transporter permease [Cellulomonas sp. P24]|uniref:ABC transporter permease n=1 Tax=Cellulomonas sp. P24 TaxID=2885206 RepID=UPI00216B57A9|nr:ABC transporter permease [Cellulomonas sp. P24]MCR6491770.1 ABC transporter permease [Cellulomonas sp. P24]